MSKLKLHRPQAFARPEGMQWDAPSNALERWVDHPMAAEASDANTISIYDMVGDDPWTGGGFTAKRMAAALRSIGNNDVTVNINSPGGDLYEGLAIYNLLAEHPATVNVRVMGLAASAASVIAMAGDSIEMGLGSFLMIHNAWGAVVGNQNDMREAAGLFAQFDGAMADIYAHRTGIDKADIAAMMDAETFMSAGDATEKGFATGSFPEPEHKGDAKARSELTARRRLDALLASKLPRSERRKLLREATGKQDAADHDDMPRAVGFDPALVASLITTIRS